MKRFLRAVLGVLALFVCLAAAAIAVLFILPDGHGQRVLTGGAAPGGAAPPVAPAPSPLFHPLLAFRRAFDGGACFKDTAFAAAATDNGRSLDTAPVAPFHRQEIGWAVYAPLAAREIATACAPDSPAFAAALSRWQAAHALAADGRMNATTLSAMSLQWLLRRPFVQAMKKGCPASPNESTLAVAAPGEAYGGKRVMARPAALIAYRRMVAAARVDLGLPPPVLTIASAYRGPAEEFARCLDGSCGGPSKAHCSAHRTGLAFDFYLDDRPGPAAFSTTDADRLRLSRTPAYLWLVANADRFGFVNYPFEPWHWEWTGEPV